MAETIKELKEGLQTAFIDSTYNSNLAFRPQFVYNDNRKGKKVLSAIEDELGRCERFDISVAFITLGGVTPLLNTLQELEKRGVPGRILTTDYLNFSEPEAMRKLASLNNIEVRMYQTRDSKDGFHTKGYLFKQKGEDLYRIIIGSSNMTQGALTENNEWNTRVLSTDKGQFAEDIVAEFKSLWESEYTKELADVIDDYELAHKIAREQRKIAASQTVSSMEAYKLKPNGMQVGFINNLKDIRAEGKDKALLISATGTGKTYASAFAMREGQQKRVLFLVHREQIAKQAMKSFKNVFGDTRSYGLLSGNSKDFDVDYLFSTMQMMAKEEIMQRFEPNEFDTIIVDEAHRVGSNSYLRIMDYFQPEFWLGMTASPERMDDFDVFAQFDHNIAYEIRLQKAMEEKLLCPFHYFGITDLEIEGETFDDDTALRDFQKLTSDERVDHVITQAQYYGYSGDRVKGLVFCSSREEAIALSKKFNERGYQTAALTGEDSQETRERCIDKLASANLDDKLDYIFTVDIFNEGVDIPEINQVIMLRPTQSPIVFVQQIGRGLRKAEDADKEFVVILDFIANYRNNFMIPIALSGDRTYNKDNVRRYVIEGDRVIPGSSTIHFDAISQTRIFKAIDSANFSDLKLIKENYKNLKYKMGHIPALADFDKYGEMDVLRIFDNQNLGSYYKFLVKHEPDYSIKLPQEQEKVIEFVSKKLASGKRIHELELLRIMLTQRQGILEQLGKNLWDLYGISMDPDTEMSVVNVMTNAFPSGAAKNTYKECVFLEKDSTKDYRISSQFEQMLQNEDFREIMSELVAFGIFRFKRDFSERYKDTDLVLYQKYTYEDACRLLKWRQNVVSLNIGGYKYDEDTKTYPVFINYNKEDNIADTIKYEDHFVDDEHLIAISKSGRTVNSSDVQNFLHSQELGIDVELFVRKNKNDNISKEFFYLGRMRPTGDTKEFTMPNTNTKAVEIGWKLDTHVREDIFAYLVDGKVEDQE